MEKDADLSRRSRQFVERFLPDVPPVERNGRTLNFTPHSLLYDFRNDYPDVQFTGTETATCLDVYIDLLADVHEWAANDPHFHPASLYAGHMDASELLLAYFHRTPSFDRREFVRPKAIEIDALATVKDFLDLIDPDRSFITVDAVKRVYSVLDAVAGLTHLSE